MIKDCIGIVIARLYYIYDRIHYQRTALAGLKHADDEFRAKYEKEINYLEQDHVDFIPYDLRYDDKVKVEGDVLSDLLCAQVYGKKLFWMRSSDRMDVEKSICGLIREQAERSPHKYTSEGFEVEEGSIIIDAGCAEAIFALQNIDKVKHAYLIEAEEKWAAPLKKTFEPYKDKVTVIKALLSVEDNAQYSTLDTLLGDKLKDEKIFLKMDLEGYGLKTLEGGEKLLAANKCIVSCATYHTDGEYDDHVNFFRSHGDWELEASEGWCFPYMHKNFAFPYFRKGVLRARNY